MTTPSGKRTAFVTFLAQIFYIMETIQISPPSFPSLFIQWEVWEGGLLCRRHSGPQRISPQAGDPSFQRLGRQGSQLGRKGGPRGKDSHGEIPWLSLLSRWTNQGHFWGTFQRVRPWRLSPVLGGNSECYFSRFEKGHSQSCPGGNSLQWTKSGFRLKGILIRVFINNRVQLRLFVGRSCAG